MPRNKYNFLLKPQTSSKEIEVHPHYKELRIEDTRDANGAFFKRTIVGELIFVREDFDVIIKLHPETKVSCIITDAITGNLKIIGTFRRADMKIDRNNRIARTSLSIDDGYKTVMANLDKEYDLLTLKPHLSRVTYKVSDCLQLTSILSQQVVSMYRKNISSTEEIGLDFTDLAKQGFNSFYSVFSCTIEGVNDVISRPNKVGTFVAPTPNSYTEKKNISSGTFTYTAYIRKFLTDRFIINRNGVAQEYWIEVWMNALDGLEDFPTITTYSIQIVTQNTAGTYITKLLSGDPLLGTPYDRKQYDATHLFDNLSSSQISVYHPQGNVPLRLANTYFNRVGARLLSVKPLSQYSRAINLENDSYIYSFYYKYINARELKKGVVFSNVYTATPTEYGVAYQQENEVSPGVYEYTPFYYNPPSPDGNFIPYLAEEWRDGWSLWVDVDVLYKEFLTGETIVINNNFCEIGEAISCLLKKIDSNISFSPTKQHSEFLYSESGFGLHSTDDINRRLRLLITQRSNANKPNADYYASKAPITLGSILTMLKEAYNLYWFIDNNHFRIEHISWFLNGGSYSSAKSVVDLRDFRDSFNDKQLSFFTNNFTYDLSKEYTTRVVEWSEETSNLFARREATMYGTYDDSNKTQEFAMTGYTPDIEYCAVFGRDANRDGFAIVSAELLYENRFDLPTKEIDGNSVVNGEMMTSILFKNWLKYDLPARYFTLDGSEEKIRVELPTYSRKNTVTFPKSIGLKSVYSDIITEVGVGSIIKLSENIDTEYITAELMYRRE